MPKFSANLGLLYPDLPLLERLAAAAADGFRAVELWYPYDIPATQLAEHLEQHGLICTNINAWPGNASAGDFGLAADATRRDEFLATVRQAVDYAAAVGRPRVHVLAGVPAAGCSLDNAWQSYEESLQQACGLAHEQGLEVLIEPLNPFDRPGYLLTRQAQAVALIQRLACPNLRLMMDVYHVQRSEGDLVRQLHEHLPWIGHIQIADVPGRREPGTGEIRYDFVLRAIDDSGYQGWVGCEYQPSSGRGANLEWLGGRVPAI